MAYALLFSKHTVAYGQSRRRDQEPAERNAWMERSDLPDKLFAEDTLSYPNSVDGEQPAADNHQVSAQHGAKRDATPGEKSPDEEMPAVEYRAEEVQTPGPLEHTPSPEDLYEPGGGNPSPGADIEDEAPLDRGGRTY